MVVYLTSYHRIAAGQMGGVEPQPRAKWEQEVENGETAFIEEFLQRISMVNVVLNPQ